MRLSGLGLALVTIGLLSQVAPSQAATVTVNLCADEGTVSLPDPATYPAPASIPIWGFVRDTGSGCGAAALPGPRLIVQQGDVVHVHLVNNLNDPAERVSILFPGQKMLPDTTGAAGGGGSKDYTFTASAPGTYLYSAGTHPDVQVPMGLYGALIVRPTGFPNVPGRAYSGSNTTFDREAVLVLSDLDPHLNTNPTTFNLADYNPTYWLINGKAYPDTASIPVPPSQRLLLRYVNAGSTNTAMAGLGVRQTVIANDAFPFPAFPANLASQTIASGQTSDTIVIAPARSGQYPLYNRQMHITNGEPNLTPPIPAGQDRGTVAPHFPGGMIAFISVPSRLIFSTTGNSTVPEVLTPIDDADIYAWNGSSAYVRLIDASGLELPDTANIDGLVVVDYDTFYASFSLDAGTSVPGIAGLVPDEDIVKYDAGTWSLHFDGSAAGLGASDDIDAFDILPNGSVIVSLRGPSSLVAGAVAQDALQCVPTTPPGVTITGCTWSMYFDGSDVGLDDANAGENVDGVSVSGGKIYLSTAGNFALSGLSGEGKDVFVCNSPITGPDTSCGAFTMYFDGSARGLAAGVGLDAIDLPN